jgi:hypothetical protein
VPSSQYRVTLPLASSFSFNQLLLRRGHVARTVSFCIGNHVAGFKACAQRLYNGELGSHTGMASIDAFPTAVKAPRPIAL